MSIYGLKNRFSKDRYFFSQIRYINHNLHPTVQSIRSDLSFADTAGGSHGDIKNINLQF